jgi:hypothetical protein
MNISVHLTDPNNVNTYLTSDNIEQFKIDNSEWSSKTFFGLMIKVECDNGLKNEIHLDEPYIKDYERWIKFCDGKEDVAIYLAGAGYLTIIGNDLVCLNYVTGKGNDVSTKVIIPISSGILGMIKEKIEFARTHELF